MNYNKSLAVTQRMANNIKFFSEKVRNCREDESINIIIETLDSVLNDLLKEKIIKSFEDDNQMLKTVYSQKVSFMEKVNTCYSFKLIGMDVRAILTHMNIIKDNFISFKESKIQNNIREIIRLSQSELFNLIFKMMKEYKTGNTRVEKIDDLIPSFGYQGALQFVFIIIAIALVESILLL